MKNHREKLSDKKMACIQATKLPAALDKNRTLSVVTRNTHLTYTSVSKHCPTISAAASVAAFFNTMTIDH